MMVASKWLDAPTLWICVAFLVAFIGVLGGVWFDSSDVIADGDDTTNTGQVTGGQTFGLVLQTYFVPLGMALWMMAVPELIKQSMAPGYKLLMLLLHGALFIAGMVYEWNAEAWQLLNCGVVFCIWENFDDDEYTGHSKKAYLYVTAVLYVLACLYFFVLLLPAILHTAKNAWRISCSELGSSKLWKYDVAESLSSNWVTEDSPLLGDSETLGAAVEAEGKGSKSAVAWAANFSVIQSNRRQRQRWCICCALGVLFPVCFILATVLPDSW